MSTGRVYLALGETSALHGMSVQPGGEGGSLHGADQVLAEAQVVDVKVDFEEGVDHAERAPLFRDGKRRAVCHRHLEEPVTRGLG